MSYQKTPHVVALYRVLLLFGLCLGCAKPPPQLNPTESANLDKILQAIQACIDQTKAPPKSKEELLPFLKPLGDPEKLLVSPRDGQPYEIAWGKNPRDFSTADPSRPLGPLLIYERQGVQGIRYVVTMHGVMLIDQKQFEEFQKGGSQK